MTSSAIFFLCTHTNLELSVVYTCTQSLQPTVYKYYHMSLGRYLGITRVQLIIDLT